jgi:AIPR protein
MPDRAATLHHKGGKSNIFKSPKLDKYGCSGHCSSYAGDKRMAANDEVVLRVNFEAWKENRLDALEGIDPWLYYCIEQFIKPFTLDDEEIKYGLTDGSNDGGADGVYFIINQGMMVQEETELEPKGVSKIRLIIFQCKTSGGFKPTEIDKIIEFVHDFFDLTRSPDSFGPRYNENIVRMMRIWRDKYLRVVGNFPEVHVDYYYITGNDEVPNANAIDSGERVKAKITDAINKVICNVHYIGASQLWAQVQRRPAKAKTLVWAEAPMRTLEGTVGLVSLHEFSKFLQDEEGVLEERIFDSNVRGYQMDSGVNKQIRKSLEESNLEENFWLLNNGVTIISPQATNAGHMGLSIEDPQIVNGLQTSREIHSYSISKSGKEIAKDGRTVLVRVIQTAEPKLQDKIIRATNSQNKMVPASLRMTDQVHRDIEEIFKKVGLYYDRRKGYYRDQAMPIRKIISVNEVVQSIVSILLQRPDDARGRPGDYFKNDEKYESVFADANISMNAYLSCVQMIRHIEQFLDKLGVGRGEQKNLKFYISAFFARDLAQLQRPIPDRLPAFNDIAKIDHRILQACYKKVKIAFDTLSLTSDGDNVGRGTELLSRLDKQWMKQYKAKQKAMKKLGNEEASG